MACTNSIFCSTFRLCVSFHSCRYLAVVSSLRCGGSAVFGWDLNLIGHDAPAVKHLGASSFQLLQYLRQLGVIVTRWTPAQHTCQIVACAQGQHPQLALKLMQSISLTPGKALVQNQALYVCVSLCVHAYLHVHNECMSVCKQAKRKGKMLSQWPRPHHFLCTVAYSLLASSASRLL